MKIWRHGYIWSVILVGCLAAWLLQPYITSSRNSHKKMYDVLSTPMGVPMEKSIPVVPKKTDWADIGLKIGSGLSGLATLTNLVEKVIKLIRRKA